jgi:hypothetical protein
VFDDDTVKHFAQDDRFYCLLGDWLSARLFFVADGEAFDLLEVVDVVAAHGFYDGPEGHGAAFGVGSGAVAVFVGDGVEVEHIPGAGGFEEGECGLELIGGVAFGPDFLVEGLDDGVGLAERGGEGLAEAEGEDHLAVSEVGDDFSNAPFAGRRAGVDLGRREAGGEGVDPLGGCVEDRDWVSAAEVDGVRI